MPLAALKLRFNIVRHDSDLFHGGFQLLLCAAKLFRPVPDFVILVNIDPLRPSGAVFVLSSAMAWGQQVRCQVATSGLAPKISRVLVLPQGTKPACPKGSI